MVELEEPSVELVEPSVALDEPLVALEEPSIELVLVSEVELEEPKSTTLGVAVVSEDPEDADEVSTEDIDEVSTEEDEEESTTGDATAAASDGSLAELETPLEDAVSVFEVVSEVPAVDMSEEVSTKATGLLNAFVDDVVDEVSS